MRKVTTVLSLVLMVALAGCTTMVKEAYYGVKGGIGNATQVQDVGSLSQYTAFKVETFKNGMPGVISNEYMALLKQKIIDEIATETTLKPRGKKVLTIRGEVVYLNSKGIAGTLLSPMNICVAHVRLIGSGKVLGWAAVAGKVKARSRASDPNIAQGVARGIVDWLVSKGVERREKEKDKKKE